MGGRPVTGYHLALVSLLLLLLHWPSAFKPWTLIDEARVISAFWVMSAVWDFLWFVFNPSFGLSRYGADHVWWFRHWALGLPVDYFAALGLAVLARLTPALLHKETPAAAARELGLSVAIPVAGAALLALAASV